MVKQLAVRTRGQGLQDITHQVSNVVKEAGIEDGLCTVFVPHTSASLVIQENADPAVLRDLARWLSELVPEARAWEHGVDELAREDSEIAEYISSLEEREDESQLPEASGDAIAKAFERYLRRRDNPPAGS